MRTASTSERRARRWGRPAVALLVSALVCAALIGAGELKAHMDVVVATREGSGFRPPPLTTVTPGPSGADLIAVVGDDWASPRNSVTNRPWPFLLQQRMGIRTRAFASQGGAYVPGSVGAGGATFGSAIDSIPPTATIVVFFGGARDARDQPAVLAASATEAMAEASQRAPGARIVVVGPVPSRPGQDAELAPVRSVLRTAAQTARATWIDPVQEKWMDSASLWAGGAPSPSAAGNERLEQRMSAALTPLLHRTTG